MANINIGLDELIKFIVQAGGDWQKTGQTEGMKTKSPATGQTTQQPTGFGQRALSAGTAGIQMPQARKQNQSLLSSLLTPQQGKQGGSGSTDTFGGLSSLFSGGAGAGSGTQSGIMSILALLGL
jgi:hypothetical protein